MLLFRCLFFQWNIWNEDLLAQSFSFLRCFTCISPWFTLHFVLCISTFILQIFWIMSIWRNDSIFSNLGFWDFNNSLYIFFQSECKVAKFRDYEEKLIVSAWYNKVSWNSVSDWMFWTIYQSLKEITKNHWRK